MIDAPRRALYYGGLGALSLGIFLLDALLPAGWVVEMLQVAVVLLTLFMRGRQSTLVLGGLTTLLVAGGALIHLSEGSLVEALINRGIVLVGLWVAVAVVLQYKKVLQVRRESEAKARAIVETTAEGIITIDEQGRIETFNPAAEAIFDCDAEAVTGEDVGRLMPDVRAEVLDRVQQATSDSAVHTETTGRRADGTTFPIDLSVSDVPFGDRRIRTAIVRDISARKRDERRQAIQYRTARILTNSDSLTDAAPQILEIICEQLHWEWGELWMVGDDELECVEVWQSSSTPLSPFERATHETTFARGEGLPGSVWESQHSRWIPDVTKDPTFVRANEAAEVGMGAGFAFPIRMDKAVSGVFVFFSREIREPDEGLLQMFSVIGNQIGQFAKRRQAERALRQSAARLRRAQRVAQLGSWEYDLEARTMVWSDQLYQMLGADSEAVDASLDTFLSFVPDEDRSALETAFREAIAREGPFSREHPLRCSSGNAGDPCWMFTQADVDPERRVLVGTTLDITELREAKKALRESEARAQAILETTVDGIITIDAWGTIETFNEAAEEIFGYAASEVIGENVKVLMPPPYREEHDEYLRSYHETGRRNIIGIGREVRGQRKDGSTFPMDLAVSEVELNDRLIFTGIVRDISERRRLEREILNISEQERRRIGQDLHDGLGQMLTGIGLLSQDVARQLKDEGHERADDMAEITEYVKEADQYARDLSHGLIPVDVDANGLSEALRRLARNAERLFDVACSVGEVGPTLAHNSAAATHLYRIAQEAVSNAAQHGEADHIKLTLATGRDQIRLQVRDDGVGFDADQLNGDGMGVQIMNYRARIIGGTLEVNSAPNEGTVVTCTLPRMAYVADEIETAPPATSE